jgi:molybdate transport system regulatory protein
MAKRTWANLGGSTAAVRSSLSSPRACGDKRAMADLRDAKNAPPRISIRIVFGEDAMLGPGKAELLERIRDTGSIAAAGRGMAMSYKRAWMLVEEMNRVFRDPLVGSSRGGAKGGGAHLTAAGEAVLANYRKLEAITAEAGAARIADLQGMLGDMSVRR